MPELLETTSVDRRSVLTNNVAAMDAEKDTRCVGRDAFRSGPSRETPPPRERLRPCVISIGRWNHRPAEERWFPNFVLIRPELDLRHLARILSEVPEVTAIHVSTDDGETHIWTIVENPEDRVLDAVYDRESALYRYFEHDHSSIEFHVLTLDKANQFGVAGREIFKR